MAAISLEGSGALTNERGIVAQGTQKLSAECPPGGLASLKSGGQPRVSPVSFATEKPRPTCASEAHLRPAHSPSIWPCPLFFTDSLFPVNNPQEMASAAGGGPGVRPRLPGWSDFFWYLP